MCVRQETNELLVIRKGTGPYQGRYDLPGGSIKPQESLLDALHREFLEETGHQVEVQQNVGVYDFLVRVPHQDTTHTHHVACFYQVCLVDEPNACGEIQRVLQTEEGTERNDSDGLTWVDVRALSDQECSPLVQKVREWLHTGEFSNEIVVYEEWEVRSIG